MHRPLMCIFDQSYKCFDLSSIEKDRPRLKQLPRVVAQELCLAAILAPLMPGHRPSSQDLAENLCYGCF